MLPRKNRISRKNFPTHKARGSRVFSPFFSAVFYQNDDVEEKQSRMATVVSKKTAKTAVARNLLRRRFYELFMPYLKEMIRPTTVVIYPKSEAQKVPFSFLKSEIEKALKQAKLI
ncbi:MAG: ribonuclease P protein component [Candidatus Yonathbacteria bacterium RIFCSPHIGHO2_01_FULL_44_41]|uniref:Ribonuclease P protein component n=1 Tax=Candidatus Yonathbacteria bacterium RIFCSPHIGHO2_02_FULL_44_14 TaxID=1802724 RepID=A0A1G2S5R4_9BACT|nr:MAG: ribonuclease P protein component [Candidatus Yonathbacteria bacterium RIFCSPHIGHO2_01_FULL_44_41]OHA80433.1 MAG: ribonuclease P protein component [Candidatus Yonathbacteria bacterium RIFCSPHIGHO2_02_FULL_44_14]OHA81687.1 MAG: ribonuclease P protein component [Candidatus Yonathbacteria bacterium RIFCSPLOWO2_01_FULL_43_20]